MGGHLDPVEQWLTGVLDPEERRLQRFSELTDPLPRVRTSRDTGLAMLGPESREGRGARAGATWTGMPLRTALPESSSMRSSSARRFELTPAWRPATAMAMSEGRDPNRGGC